VRWLFANRNHYTHFWAHVGSELVLLDYPLKRLIFGSAAITFAYSYTSPQTWLLYGIDLLSHPVIQLRSKLPVAFSLAA